jgi:hypothetical protein
MSAYQVFDSIQFRDRECLLQALEAIGYGQDKVEVHDRPQTLYGYHGDARPEKAEVIIRRRHVGRASNDVGFALKDGAYVPIISEYDRSTSRWNDAAITRLKTEYARAAVNKVVSQKRATVLSNQRKGSVQTIRVRLYAS